MMSGLYAFVRMCEPENVEVTGITFMELGGKYAEVECKYTQRITPFGLNWHDEEKIEIRCPDAETTVRFKLYDDGWRLAK